MDQEIIVAGLALVGSLSGTYFANRRATALIAYRLEQLEKNASLTVEKCELRSFDGNPVIYMENSFTFNDEVIDQMIENELWTEESLEQAGGRETILAIPDSHSIVVYGILDGNLVIYGGTYYEDAQKQEVLDAINIMLQTTEIE